jgi:halocyanin-like protein
MTRSPPPIQRRRFLTAAGATGLAGLAGCTALTGDGEQEQTPQSQIDGDLQAETPEQIVESYLEVVQTAQQRRNELHHSAVSETFSLEAVTTSVVEEDLSEREITERAHLDSEEVEKIVADAETAAVQAEIEITRDSETVSEQAEWLVATDDGEWRLVEQGTVGSYSTGESDSEADRDSEPEPDPEMPGAVHEYMIENEVRAYDGSLADKTGMDSVTIDVGGGDQGLAFDPPVVRVDAGTDVVWEWTGEGGAHNVVSTDAPEEFSNEEIVGEADHTWSYTFDQSGTYFYTCEPHRPIGMHGAIIVE